MATAEPTPPHPTPATPASTAGEPAGEPGGEPGGEPAGPPPPAARRSPRRGGLSRDRILQAALTLVDADGLPALTMRRLGQALDRDPMALYRYIPNREALLEGVAELVLSQLVIPTDPTDPADATDTADTADAADTVDWPAQLRRSAHDFRALARAHPHVVPLLATRPLSTPLGLRPLGTLRPLEQLLELLIGVGFAPEDALRVYRTYFGFVYGHILTELQELVVDPDETDDLLRLGLHRLPPREFPRVRSLAGAFAAYDGATELDHGLDVLIAGLQAHLHPRTPTNPPPPPDHKHATPEPTH